MKRKIIFRGKATNILQIGSNIIYKKGDWVHGNLIQQDGDVYILPPDIRIPFGTKACSFTVDPKTVGQFTGLQDKNGENIYEDDIVRWDDCSNGKHFRIALVKINPDIQFDCSLNLSYKGMVSSSDACFSYGNFINTDTHNYLEVIGNIHCKLT